MATVLNNRYRIVQTLGRGGFGQTFLAVDTQIPSQRKCVIKQLEPIKQDPEFQEWAKERFEREAALLEELGAQNTQIPQLYAYLSEGGNFYLVQEWIEGQTLTDKVIEVGVLPEEKVKEILVSLLPVLEYIHTQRIIHRDIKPDNIILRASDGLPVLIDFGIVKEAMATWMNPDQKTPYSVGIGTPGYMPSEQAAGRPVYSSDLYSLGLTAIFLLTGKNPPDLATEDDSGELLWRKYVPNIDSNFAKVIERAIRFVPRDRFSSAREMLQALQFQSIYSGAPTLAVAPGKSQATTVTEVVNSPVAKSNKLVKFLVTFLLIGGVGIATVVISLALFIKSLFTPSPPIQQAEQPTVSSPVEQAEQPTVSSPVEQAEEPTASSPVEQSEQPTVEKPTSLPSEESNSPPIFSPPEPPPKQADSELPESNGINVPTFATKTQGRQIIATLGKPTKSIVQKRENLIALYYKDVVPERVHIAYFIDNNRKILHHTEVFFNKSVGLKVMEKTITDLLGSNDGPPIIKQALEQVYHNQTDLRSFRVDNFKVIVRSFGRDRIDIAVWDTDF